MLKCRKRRCEALSHGGQHLVELGCISPRINLRLHGADRGIGSQLQYGGNRQIGSSSEDAEMSGGTYTAMEMPERWPMNTLIIDACLHTALSDAVICE
jgi:hypothetical protein